MREDLQEQMRRGVKAAHGRIYSKSEPSISRDRFNKRNEAQWLESNAIFHRWMEKHPEIPRNSEGGVAQSVQQLFERYMDFCDEQTAADFEFAYGNLKSQIQLVRVPTPAEVKAHLIDRICELIASKNDGQDGKFSKYALENERKKMGL